MSSEVNELEDNEIVPECEVKTPHNNNADNDEDKKPNQADLIMSLMNEYTRDIFVNEIGEAFAMMNINQTVQTHLVRGSTFKLFLTGLYYQKTKKVPSSESIKQVASVAESMSLFNGVTQKTHLRCASTEDKIIYDLANTEWQSVLITSKGWSVETSPIGMIRASNTAPQVTPIRGGNIELLKPFLNVRSENDFILTVIWMAYCIMCPNLPKPLICLHGSKGGGKSTFQKVIRRIIDPASAELTGLPSTEESFALQANKNYCLCFDNISKITKNQSDFICTVSTGGAFTKRKLYSDNEEVILKFCRPVTLSGINVIAEESDLLDRSLLVELNRIPKNGKGKRRGEEEFWGDFEKVRPLVLGAIFDAIVTALRMSVDNTLELERMADFTKVGYKLANSFNVSGETFLKALRGNTEKTLDTAIQASPVAQTIVKLLETRGNFEGTSTALHKALNDMAYELRLGKVFPKSTAALTRELRPLITDLKAININVEEIQNKKTKQTSYFVTKNVSALSAVSASLINQGLKGGDISGDIRKVSPLISNRGDGGEYGGDIAETLFKVSPPCHPSNGKGCGECGDSGDINDITLYSGEI